MFNLRYPLLDAIRDFSNQSTVITYRKFSTQRNFYKKKTEDFVSKQFQSLALEINVPGKLSYQCIENKIKEIKNSNEFQNDPHKFIQEYKQKEDCPDLKEAITKYFHTKFLISEIKK